MGMFWDPTRGSAQPYYDLTALSFRNVKETGLGGGEDIMWEPNGSKMYLLNSGDNSIRSYTLSTNYDVTTATELNSYGVGSEDDLPAAIAWNGDGSKFYMTGFRDVLYSYSCSTAYDISTASVLNSRDLSGDTSNPNCLDWNGDGTKFYAIDDFNDLLRSWTLSTPYDITTASYNNDFDVDPIDDNMKDVDWNGDGSKMYTVGASGDNVYSYTCSTAYDITTASLLNTFDVSAKENAPDSMEWDNIGSNLYVFGSNTNVYAWQI